MFIEKYAPKEADNLYNTFATILNLNPTLTDEKNYYNLLDALISIEENQIMVDVRDYDTMSQLTFIAGNTYDLEVCLIFLIKVFNNQTNHAFLIRLL